MRWVFWVLLLLNIGLLVWRFGTGLPARYQARTAAVPAAVSDSVRSLRLLGEPAQSASRAAVMPARRPVCKLVGPFSSSSDADIFLERLRALDIRAKRQGGAERGGAEKGSESYWVYLDRFPSRAAAREQFRDLQARNIDSYIIQDGELANGISLGMFSELALAQARLKDMISQGLQAKMKSVSRNGSPIWLILPEEEVQKIGVSAWQRMLKEPFDLSEKQNFCLDVAS